MIEADNGGLFRSDDGGNNWEKVNSNRALRQRAWYYTRIYADTQNVDKIFVLNVSYGVSTDGGKTFTLKNAPHGDHHDLWIDPNNNMRMVIADDGGAQVSNDGGENWTTYMNQPTAQFYRVTTDDHFHTEYTEHSKIIVLLELIIDQVPLIYLREIGNLVLVERVPILLLIH